MRAVVALHASFARVVLLFRYDSLASVLRVVCRLVVLRSPPGRFKSDLTSHVLPSAGRGTAALSPHCSACLTRGARGRAHPAARPCIT